MASAGRSATAGPARSELAGTWRADFEAKKGSVTLDPGVSEPAWKKDDGSQAVGAGSVEIVVGADGTVSGELSGALGKAIVAGSAEENSVTATFAPSNGGELAMHGTLSLTREGEALVGSLRASSGDARLVRMASLSLRRADK